MAGRAEYGALLRRLDDFAHRVHADQGDDLACRRGCDTCCHTRRTAWAVEIDHLTRWLAERPVAERERLRARRLDPAVSHGERCVFLAADGACAVYGARPVICRTHGPAVTSEATGLVWCALNFTGHPIETVAERVHRESVLDLDHVNRLLALINARFCADRERTERADLETALEFCML